MEKENAFITLFIVVVFFKSANYSIKSFRWIVIVAHCPLWVWRKRVLKICFAPLRMQWFLGTSTHWSKCNHFNANNRSLVEPYMFTAYFKNLKYLFWIWKKSSNWIHHLFSASISLVFLKPSGMSSNYKQIIVIWKQSDTLANFSTLSHLHLASYSNKLG